MTIPPSRPDGVKILVIFLVLIGLLSIANSTVLLAITGLRVSEGHGGEIATQAGTIYTAMEVVGVVSLFLSYQLWKGKGRAWAWTMILAVLSVIFAVVRILLRFPGMNELMIMMEIVAIALLSTTQVKAFFGRAPPQPAQSTT